MTRQLIYILVFVFKFAVSHQKSEFPAFAFYFQSHSVTGIRAQRINSAMHGDDAGLLSVYNTNIFQRPASK